ncbi:hypothetical protein SDC9_119068 [bioreactor metagenome]|uniref:Uncharacterized protein n=1 Tax=bioreactor metagenome TaxID=1076179 RepID=A0A645C3H4_9ZZZZ
MRPAAGTPFFTDNAALFFQLFIFQRNPVRPVVKDKQYRIHQILVCGGDIGQKIDGFIERSIGVDVCPEFNAVVLQIIEHIFARIIFCSVESHMLQEVRQSGLVVFFLHRPYFLSDVEIGPVLG